MSKIYWKVGYRLAILFSALKGDIQVRDALHLAFSPSSQTAKLSTSAGKRIVLRRPFYFPRQSYGEFLGLLREIIATDQYFARSYLHPESVVIDAGANLGMFAALAASLGSQVYAFEPAPRTYEFLIKNIAPYSRIHPLQLGLGDSVTPRRLLLLRSWTGGNAMEDSPVAPNLQPVGSTMVRLTTIDQFVRDARLSRVDFIKIDTEGYEAPILRGAAETIKKFRPVIAMSAYHCPEDKVSLPRTLQSIAPYDCRLEHRSEEDLICVPVGGSRS